MLRPLDHSFSNTTSEAPGINSQTHTYEYPLNFFSHLRLFLIVSSFFSSSFRETRESRRKWASCLKYKYVSTGREREREMEKRLQRKGPKLHRGREAWWKGREACIWMSGPWRTFIRKWVRAGSFCLSASWSFPLSHSRGKTLLCGGLGY